MELLNRLHPTTTTTTTAHKPRPTTAHTVIVQVNALPYAAVAAGTLEPGAVAAVLGEYEPYVAAGPDVPVVLAHGCGWRERLWAREGVVGGVVGAPYIETWLVWCTLVRLECCSR